ncbi:hypothetical protein [Sphingomonas sanxanigenens]|uniref:HTH cro/C1-type domain-containing protein n=1 Tax=Sphingomonas sanxanigenens DSM 19645 = NX02 TaxID=1123269 RepID=W0AG70_9SPHN|nr:hypothetical protein [Sphingomonas sanxanigenens]AHE55522.1 hypothetical protein NX02_19290 [Sphingomonas sanxanigenens DSM 19645 = NX02]
MKLSDYLAANSISYAEFARKIGAQHRRTVERYAKGARIPIGKMMAAIAIATGGQVQPNDFFAPPDPGGAEDATAEAA